MVFSRSFYMRQIWVIAILFLCSCQVFDRPEKVPSFIHIDHFDFSITHSSQGSSSNKITDAWVYMDGNLEGVYELPSTIPLHYEGNHRLKIYPGIKQNGIAGDRTKYDFYKAYELDITLFPDSIIPVHPSTEYEDQLFFWIENFEDPQSRFTTYTISDTSLEITNQPQEILFDGSNIGEISLNSSQEVFEMRTDELDFNQFPKNINIPAYIEMNYANNYPFTVGILHKDDFLPYMRQPLITLTPTHYSQDSVVWNKTYLYIPDATNFYPSATSFDLYIGILNSDYSDDVKVRLDNIKVIFRQ